MVESSEKNFPLLMAKTLVVVGNCSAQYLAKEFQPLKMISVFSQKKNQTDVEQPKKDFESFNCSFT